MTEEEVELSRLLQESRMKPNMIMRIFRKLRGSSSNVTFKKRVLSNMKQEERWRKKNTDIDCTLKFVEQLQIKNAGVCYKLETDATNTMLSIFWTHARSKLDYRMYGQVISFDTTYSTNRYNMPFAPIIGINGHAKIIVFGWALLKDQSVETFHWLFDTFIEAMDWKKPDLILTD